MNNHNGKTAHNWFQTFKQIHINVTSWYILNVVSTQCSNWFPDQPVLLLVRKWGGVCSTRMPCGDSYPNCHGNWQHLGLSWEQGGRSPLTPVKRVALSRGEHNKVPENSYTQSIILNDVQQNYKLLAELQARLPKKKKKRIVEMITDLVFL